MRKFAFFLLTAGILLCLGCNKVNIDGNYVTVDSITLSQTEAMLSVGGTLDLTVKVTPAKAAASVKWESSNNAVASVSNGHVTANALGNATIKAKAGSKEALCKVNVVKLVPVEGVSIEPSLPTVGIGNTVTLSARISPSTATNLNVTWKSETPAVASVDAQGVVTGKSRGNAKITVTTEDGGKTASTTVSVVQPVTSFTITTPNPDDYDMEDDAYLMTVGEKWQIQVNPTPSDHDDTFKYYIFNGSSYLDVSESGLITAKQYSEGKTCSVAIGTKADLFLRYIKIKVLDKIDHLYLSNHSQDMIDIGSGAEISDWFIINSNAWKQVKIVGQSGSDMTYSIGQTDNGTPTLSVKAPKVSIENTSSASKTVSSTVTLRAGTKTAPFQRDLTFIQTYYDPHEPKPGDVIKYYNGMTVKDGGYRGNGVLRTGLGGDNTNYNFDVAIIACLTDKHLQEDPTLSNSSYAGPDNASIHGIAIPCNTIGLERTTNQPWDKTIGGEIWQGSHSDVENGGSGYIRIANASSSVGHTAFYNTAAILNYCNSGNNRYDVRPVIYCSSETMKTFWGASSLRYSDYYYDSKTAIDLINKTCPAGTEANRMSKKWVPTKCSPWLLPTVADLLSVFSGKADVSGTSSINGISEHIKALNNTLTTTCGVSISLEGKSWWTSQDKDTDNAWSVSVNSSGTTTAAAAENKDNVRRVLPILYF